MSFTFNWPRFSDQFHYDAIQMLNTALNKGNKPPVIADKIEVVELEMGTVPPELEIRDIGDLTVDHFRGIFRLTYAGDAYLVLKTKVQANPLNHKQPDIHLMGTSRGMLAAKQPLVVPMLLRLSHFRLSSYVVLVVSKQKGITLVFKTDPLQHVDINSTFDSIAVIQNFIQREIEGQLRQMFREDLPGIIHRLSQQWVKAKVEAPYLSKRPAPTPLIPKAQRQNFDTMSAPDLFPHRAVASEIGIGTRKNLSYNTRRPPRAASTSGFSHRPALTPLPSSSSAASTPNLNLPAPEPSSSSHPDLENFDPTYGLRPEGLPTKSVFKSFSSLFTPNKGLADLAEEAEESSASAVDSDYEYEEETETEDGGSFDFVDWDSDAREREREYETIPAVGGGTITRPRVYHSQSAIQTHTLNGNGAPPTSSTHLSRSFSSLPPPPLASAPIRSYSMQSAVSNPYFPEYPPPHPPLSATANGPVAGPSRIHHPSHLNLSSSSATLGAPLRTAPPGPGYPYAGYTPYPLPSRLRGVDTPDSYDLDSPFSSSRSTSSGPPTRRSTISPGILGGMTIGTGVPPSASAIYMRRPLSSRRLSVTSEVTERSRAPIVLHHENGFDYDNDNDNDNESEYTDADDLGSLHPSRHLHPLHATTSHPASLSHTSLLSTSPSQHTVHGFSSANSTSPSYSASASNSNSASLGTHKIVLRPSLNSSSIHKLSTLSTSNHTLSPYTRDLSHFTVRSVPPRSASGSSGGLGGVGVGGGGGGGGAGGGGVGGARGKGAKGGAHGHGHGQDRAPVKARRKRVFRLGGGGGASRPSASTTAEGPTMNGSLDPHLPPHTDPRPDLLRRRSRRTRHHHPGTSHSPGPPSEFDESDMDRYFTYDERDHEAPLPSPVPAPPPPQSSSSQGPVQPRAQSPQVPMPKHTHTQSPMQSPKQGVPRRMSSRPRLAQNSVSGGTGASASATSTGVAPRL